MSMAEPTEDTMMNIIQAAIHHKIGQMVEEEIEKSKAALSRRIGEIVSSVSLDVLHHISFERRGLDVVITCRGLK